MRKWTAQKIWTDFRFLIHVILPTYERTVKDFIKII